MTRVWGVGAAAAVAAMLLVPGGAARAELCEVGGKTVDIEYWAGTGASTAVCVIDFEPGVSYAFGFRWDGAATGFEMLQAIAAAGDLEFEYDTDWGDPFVDTIRYAGRSMGLYWGWPADWLGYWVSTDGESWADSFVGAADRLLGDGDWDAWSRQTTDAWPPAYAPTTPPSLVSVLKGREIQRLGRGYGLEGWEDLDVGTRHCVAVVHHNAVAADGGLRVAAIELVCYGRDAGRNRYAEIRTLGGAEFTVLDGRLAGIVEGLVQGDDIETRWSAAVEGRTDGADRIRRLSGPLTVTSRDEPGRLQAFAQFQWLLTGMDAELTAEQAIETLARHGYDVGK